MSDRLGTDLQLGPLVATAADELCLARVEACVRATLDYFRKDHGSARPERIAADRLGEPLADDRLRLYLLADPEGAPAGLLELALAIPEPGEATVALLVIARRLRSRGLGTQVARALFSVLAAGGYARVRLGVARGEDGAARFWSSLGMWQHSVEDGVRLFELDLEAARRKAG